MRPLLTPLTNGIWRVVGSILVVALLCLTIVWALVSLELAVGVAAAIVTIGAAVLTAVSTREAAKIQQTVDRVLAHNEIRILLNVQAALNEVYFQYLWRSSTEELRPPPYEYAPRLLRSELSALGTALLAARPLRMPAAETARSPGSNEKPNEGEWSGYKAILEAARGEIEEKLREFQQLIDGQPASAEVGVGKPSPARP